jgi:hypothetical protein
MVSPEMCVLLARIVLLAFPLLSVALLASTVIASPCPHLLVTVPLDIFVLLVRPPLFQRAESALLAIGVVLASASPLHARSVRTLHSQATITLPHASLVEPDITAIRRDLVFLLVFVLQLSSAQAV